MMLRRGWLGALVVAVDAAVLIAAAFLTFQAWLWYRPHLELIVQVRFLDLTRPNPWGPPLPLLVGVWLFFLRQQGFYDPLRMFTVLRSLQALSASAARVLVFVAALQFFFPERVWSRLLVAGSLILGFAGLAAWRFVLLRLQRRTPSLEGSVVIFGVGDEAALMAERLHRDAPGFNLAGFLAPQRSTGEVVVPGAQVLGTADQLRQVVNQHHVQTIVFASRSARREEALELATRSSQLGLRVLQVPFTWGVASPRLDLAQLGELELIDLSGLGYPSLVETAKRAFDLVSVALLGTLLSPVLLLTALAVKMDSPGPILFAAPRVGKGGRSFPFYKFRSMVVDADAQKETLRHRNESDGLLFKIKEDPRITRVGRFIRKWSLDELPQFWNVVRGDMNLVGPRPLPVKDLESAEGDPEIAYWFELRHRVPPGITGLWQVKGRSNLGFKEMVQLDIYYIQHWSIWLDLKILLLTVPAVLKGRGAS